MIKAKYEIVIFAKTTTKKRPNQRNVIETRSKEGVQELGDPIDAAMLLVVVVMGPLQ